MGGLLGGWPAGWVVSKVWVVYCVGGLQGGWATACVCYKLCVRQGGVGGLQCGIRIIVFIAGLSPHLGSPA